MPLRVDDRPPWLQARVHASAEVEAMRRLVAEQRLHTVCFSAACPNLGECWSRGTATFMIGGNHCTRRCGFCDVTTARPGALDPGEPARVAEAVARLGLRFAVVTCVARDDLADGGAAPDGGDRARHPRALPGHRRRGADRRLRRRRGGARASCSTPAPDVLNHNLETVERLQRRVRPAASYARSLARAAARGRAAPRASRRKSGLMLGLGEARGRAARGAPRPPRRGRRAAHAGPVPAAVARRTFPWSAGCRPRSSTAWAAEARGARLRGGRCGPPRAELLPRRAARGPGA